MLRSRLLRTFIVAVLALAVAGLVALSGLYVSVAADMTPPEDLIDPDGSGIQMLDRNGNLLFEFTGAQGGLHTPVTLSEISSHLINATIATEDGGFWQNPGISFRGISRAIYENLAFWKHGGFLRGSGGSSITQQLAKNLYIPPESRTERSFKRKLRETILAFELTRRYSKEEILEWYLNILFYGNSAYGAEAAAQRYFSKHASDLTLAEAAMLAGIPSAPAIYDPINNPTIARARQEQVLSLMVRDGYITEEQAQAALAEQLNLRSASFPIRAPHFVMYTRELLTHLVDDAALKGSLRVTTTLDLALQEKAETIVRDHVAALAGQVGASNAALVAIDPQTGEILAMVGSPDYFDDTISGQVNNALALNQPGSAIKPITYLAAFQKGWSPATLVPDRPMALSTGSKTFMLSNADGRYRGEVSARNALANSLNVPAVHALEFAGLPYVHSLARQMGLTTLLSVDTYGLSFTLGAVDVSLLDMTYMYSVLANGGAQAGMAPVRQVPEGARRVEPVAVLRIENAQGKVLWERQASNARVISEEHAYLVTHILSDNKARTDMFGAGTPLELARRPAAVKTGLSDSARDAWTIGYTPQLVVGVWVGNTDNSPMEGATSVRTASPIWHDFMTAALANQPAKEFTVPDGVRFVTVCATTGLLPARGCPQVVNEVFLAELVPTTTGFVTQVEDNRRGIWPAISDVIDGLRGRFSDRDGDRQEGTDRDEGGREGDNRDRRGRDNDRGGGRGRR